MSRIILLLVVLAVVMVLNYRYRRLNIQAKKRMQRLFWAVMAIGLLVALALTGKLSWLIAGIGALLPLLPRAARLFMGVWPTVKPFFQRYRQNHKSDMRGRYVSLQIDMLSGELQGEVLAGEYAGQKLQSMSLEQVLQLLDYCKIHDAESAALLVAYLDRQHSHWRNKGGGNDNGGNDNSSREEAFFSDSVMSREQAIDILGLKGSPSKSEIKQAHKRLMQHLHPDRGGTDYLARQINGARDILLKDS